MRVSPTQADATGAPSAPAELSWRCHPARRHPGRAAAVVVFHIFLCLLIAQYTASLPFALVLTAVLFFSLSAFFFPASYQVTEQGIKVKTVLTTFERPWNTYRSYWPDKNGVLLSPFPHRSRLENFRGLFVRFHDNGDEVLAFVKRFVAEPEAEA